MGRPLGRPKAEWHLRLPIDLASQIDLLLSDPRYERTKYGARSLLMENLLLTWLHKTPAEDQQLLLSTIKERAFGPSAVSGAFGPKLEKEPNHE